MIFEVCIDSVEGALAAQAAGAQRVELCANLVEGGTTPSPGMLQLVRQAIKIDMNVIIRPRGGDFLYTDFEFEVMKQDIIAAHAAGANGVVLGLLHPDGSLDLARTRILVKLARNDQFGTPMSVTFHRAFDLCRDPYQALEDICSLGIERILTSGQKNSAIEGLDCLARLVQLAAGRTIIMAGGGVNDENIARIAQIGIREMHFSARKNADSPMTYRNPDIFMGKAYQPDEYNLKVPDLAHIQKIIQAAS